MGKCIAHLKLKPLLSLFLLVMAAFAQPALSSSCRPDQLEIHNTASGQIARFSVEIADTPQLQQKGLMFREKLAASAGMLFTYERPSHAVFWMRNTLIPLDMIFADATGLITRVHENAVPHDETLIDGGENVSAVFEINGGLARKMGIREGSVMRHQTFSSSLAIFPCN